MLQLWHVKTLGMWSTVKRCSRETASPLDRRYVSSVIKATSCPATASSPATTEIQLHPSGARGCPSVSVSHTRQEIIHHGHGNTHDTQSNCLSALNTWLTVNPYFHKVQFKFFKCACCWVSAFLLFLWPKILSCFSAEKYEPCRNPGAASTSVQSSEKAFYQAGEMLTFSCHSGYELQGEATIYCIPGHPSQWNSTPPSCRGKPCPHTVNFSFDIEHIMCYWFCCCLWMYLFCTYVHSAHCALCYTTPVQILTNLPLCLCSVLGPICEWTQARWWVMFWDIAISIYWYFFCVHNNRK